MAFLPGYYKSAEAYRDNNRIKKVLLEYLSRTGAVMYCEEMSFEDRPYRQLDYSNFFARLQYPFSIDYDYFEYIDADGKLIEDWTPGTVRVTIMEVYSGEKIQ